MSEKAPHGWAVRPLGQLAKLERGKFSARPRNDPRYYGGKYPFIQTGDVRNSGGTISSYSQTLNEAGLKVSKLFPKGTLFLTIAANIGDLGVTQFASAAPDSLVAVRPTAKIDQSWLQYALSARKSVLESTATQNAQANLNLAKLNPFPLLVPPRKEQTVIAASLGDADALARALEQMIAKTQAIKQGVAQEIVTGSTRLPGYTGGWSTATYRDIITIRRGEVFIARDDHADGTVPVIAAGRSPAAFTNRANRPGPVVTISASGASAGFLALHATSIFASDCSTISPGEGFDLRFIFYSLKLQQNRIYQAQAGGAQPHVHAKDIYPLEVLLPPTVDEQRAISEVLRDIDDEIDRLNDRLVKARAVRQGMLQELLTGRIRLPVEGAAA
jgi:type I restriction enzyme S subunit